MSKEVVAKEVAEAEFARLCAANSIESDVSLMSEDELSSFNDTKGKIVRAIQDGALTVDEEGIPTYQPTTKGVKAFTVRPASASTVMAMDAADGPNNGPVHRIVRALQEMAGIPSGSIAKLNMRDFRVCMALASLFLQAG